MRGVATLDSLAWGRAAGEALRRPAALALLLGLWEGVSTFLVNPKLVPPPTTVVETAWQMLMTGELLWHLAVSLQRVLVGYLIGGALGVALGVLMGRIRWVEDLLDPPLELIRSISPVAMVPLAIVWFGIGEQSKYFIIVYSTIVIVLLNTAAGVKTTPIIRVRAAQCLGASRLQIFLEIVIPSAMPYILIGLRIAIGFAFMGVIAAEVIAARSGVGYLIMEARMLVQTDRMFVGLLSLGAIGAATDWLFRRLIRQTMTRFRGEVIF